MTLTVTTSTPGGDTPRVQVNVASSPAVTGPLRVFRTHADGSVHRVLLEDNANIVTTYAGLDFHSPFNQAVTYHAEAGGLVSVESAAQWLTSDDTWLVHRSDQSLSVMVEKLIGPAAPVKFPSRANRYQVLNRRLPVFRSDYPRGGESGQLVVKCEADARPGLEALLADDGVLLLNSPLPDLGWKWIKPLDLDFSNPGGFQSFPFRYATIPYEESNQPDADEVPLWTSDDIAALGLTSAGLAALYTTSDNMKLDIRVP